MLNRKYLRIFSGLTLFFFISVSLEAANLFLVKDVHKTSGGQKTGPTLFNEDTHNPGPGDSNVADVEKKPMDKEKGGTIEKGGKKKRKKIPLLLVLGVAVVAIIAALLLKKKKPKQPEEYTLTVTVGEGVQGTPATGTSTYSRGDSVNYSYSLQDGYSNLVVRLDGNVISSSGTVEMNANRTLTATADPNVLSFVTDKNEVPIDEGRTADFTVRLSAQPPGNVNVTVNWVSGDTDIIVQSGSSFTFSTSDWDQTRTVTLEAREDSDITSDTATIRISANGAYQIPDKDITATEQDTDELRFETDTNSVTVREGGIAQTVRVRLSNQPLSDIQVSVTRISGDTDIYVSSGENLTFSTTNWNTYQNVKFKAAEDADITDGQATFRISGSGVRDKDITATEDDNDEDICTLSIQITSPSNGATVSGTVTIRAAVTGTCVVDRVEFYIDDNLLDTDSTAPYTANWDTTTYIQASHNIRVIVYDANNAQNTDEDLIPVTVTRSSSQGSSR